MVGWRSVCVEIVKWCIQGSSNEDIKHRLAGRIIFTNVTNIIPSYFFLCSFEDRLEPLVKQELIARSFLCVRRF
jgi:hypothetical protein